MSIYERIQNLWISIKSAFWALDWLAVRLHLPSGRSVLMPKLWHMPADRRHLMKRLPQASLMKAQQKSMNYFQTVISYFYALRLLLITNFWQNWNQLFLRKQSLRISAAWRVPSMKLWRRLDLTAILSAVIPWREVKRQAFPMRIQCFWKTHTISWRLLMRFQRRL